MSDGKNGSPTPRGYFDWIILNQSQSPAFQRMMEAVSGESRCLIQTGVPFPAESPNVILKQGPRYDRRSLRHRAGSWLAFTGSAAARSLSIRGRPFLFTTTNPPILPHLAWALHRARGWPYGVLVWDIYPHALVQSGLLPSSNPLIRGWSALNRQALRDASVVIALGKRMGDIVAAELGSSASRDHIRIIPNWADTQKIRPIPKQENPFAREHGLVSSITVMYSGNLGATHGLEVLVAAADLLRDDRRIRFVIIGDGLGRDAVEREISQRRLENVVLLPLQPWDRVPYSLAAGDIAIVSQARGTERFSFPSKVFSALAAGSAICAVTAEDSDLAELVREHDVGEVVPWGDADRLARGLGALADDPARLRALQVNARHIAESLYSESAVKELFCAELRPLIERSRFNRKQRSADQVRRAP